ncbi:MAG: hypothetical protein SNJ71_03645 [Bacteroidales bacterium]
MKTYKIKLLVLLFPFFSLIVSCENQECANCRIVTKDSTGKVIKTEQTKQYCGTELDEIESKKPVKWENETSEWECK